TESWKQMKTIRLGVSVFRDSTSINRASRTSAIFLLKQGDPNRGNRSVGKIWSTQFRSVSRSPSKDAGHESTLCERMRAGSVPDLGKNPVREKSPARIVAERARLSVLKGIFNSRSHAATVEEQAGALNRAPPAMVKASSHAQR